MAAEQVGWTYQGFISLQLTLVTVILGSVAVVPQFEIGRAACAGSGQSRNQ